MDRALQQALDSLLTAARLATSSNGEQAVQVIGAQFDTALTAVETLMELRAGDLARTAAALGVAVPTVGTAAPPHPGSRAEGVDEHAANDQRPGRR